MRMSWPVLVVALSLSLPLATAAAQQEVLDSLVHAALKDNPALSAASHVRQSTAEAARGAAALPDPSLSFGLMNLPANSFSLDQTPMSSMAVGLSQRIPWPGKLSARGEMAATMHREAGAVEQIVRNRVVREVTDAYLDYSYWSASLVIIREYLELLRQTTEIAQTRYANGDAPAQDVLRAGSKTSRTQVRLLQTEQKRLSSLLRLRQAVGDTTISDELPAYLAEPRDTGVDTATIEGNPMLARAASAVEQAEAGRRLARLEYWPEFTLGVDYSIRRDIRGDPVHGADFLTFKAGISVPLWFFAKQKHQVRSANEALLATQERERSVRDTLVARYYDAVSSLSATLASLDTYDKSLMPEAAAAVEAAQAAYEVGRVDFNALLAAQSDDFEIKLERLDYLRQYHKTKAALAELAGSSSER